MNSKKMLPISSPPAQFLAAILPVLSVLLLTACEQNNFSEFSGDFIQNVPSDWKPENVNFTCSSPPCPESVGLLVATNTTTTRSGNFIDRTQNAQLCTGALTESKKLILTNGHCNPFRTGAGLPSPLLWQRKVFITVKADGKPSQVYNIGKEMFHVDDPTTTLSSDVAVLELTDSVWDREPLKIARTYNLNLKDFVTFVVNQQNNNKSLGSEFRLTKNTCVSRPEIPFPFLDSDKVNLMFGYDCVLRHGNSGSPFFSPGQLTTIEGVIQAVSNPIVFQEVMDARRKKIGEQKFRLEEQEWKNNLEKTKKAPARAIGTRIACLSIPVFGGGRENCLPYQPEVRNGRRR